ncbi:FAD:protein FMN transferase [Phaeacidiphilus oryzae]|uniref:FAD:protein FMN transferase n=1 Tax=Phaeacidiphilus oryzae TaxID=348818 RepID=UPI000567B020|nr:FAD:protein FMN transferase [Phaeacidiphilus oryzae]
MTAAVFRALGTNAEVHTALPDRRALAAAEAEARAELSAIDLACSRFRADSELSWANAAAGGGPVSVGPVLAEALDAAWRAAELTGGAVDPTVGRSVAALGYDRDFSLVAARRPEEFGPLTAARPAPGIASVDWDPASRTLTLPAGTALDLGATAKALAADRCARRAARAAGCGVMVNLGGDLSIAGEPPEGGWRVEIADDHAAPDPEPGPVVVLRDGGLATSGTAVRRWQRAGGGTVHHIVDPRTGRTPPAVWRTVSIAAADCVDANTAATAALVLGEDAADWLRGTGLPARLVQEDGAVLRLGDWPEPERLLEQHTKGGRG